MRHRINSSTSLRFWGVKGRNGGFLGDAQLGKIRGTAPGWHTLALLQGHYRAKSLGDACLPCRWLSVTGSHRAAPFRTPDRTAPDLAVEAL